MAKRRYKRVKSTIPFFYTCQETPFVIVAVEIYYTSVVRFLLLVTLLLVY